MRISDNISIYTGMTAQGAFGTTNAGAQKEAQNSKSIYGGNLNNDLLHDSVLQRRKAAQEKAMQVVGDAFAGDLEIDGDLAKRRLHMEELKAENKELLGELKYIDEQQAKRHQQEELLEKVPVEEMLIMEQARTDIQREVQQIVDKMKLVAEDIKGAVVDESL